MLIRIIYVVAEKKFVLFCSLLFLYLCDEKFRSLSQFLNGACFNIAPLLILIYHKSTSSRGNRQIIAENKLFARSIDLRESDPLRP